MKEFVGSVVAISAAVAIGIAAAPPAASEDAAVHVLNRVAFGPRPGEVDRVRSLGTERYIDEQLHPERIPDRDADARTAGLETVRMSSRELSEQIERPIIEARRQRKQGGDADAAAAPPPMQQRANLP